MRWLLAIALGLLMVVPGAAEQLISTVSRTEVAITSSFDGETLTFFGNIEPETGSADRLVEGPYHIIIVVRGPLIDRIARKKTNLFGIWVNTQQVLFKSFPSYFQVMSDARITDITDPITIAELGVMPDHQARITAQAGWWDAIVYGQELVRLMTQEGLFGVNERGVVFRSNTLYSAQVSLASNALPGSYIAQTYLFKDGRVVGTRADRFVVRKIGFERFLGQAAVQQPLLYGIAAVILALFTGWLGGVVFRR